VVLVLYLFLIRASLGTLDGSILVFVGDLIELLGFCSVIWVNDQPSCTGCLKSVN